jgi:hypothetical protein
LFKKKKKKKKGKKGKKEEKFDCKNDFLQKDDRYSNTNKFIFFFR